MVAGEGFVSEEAADMERGVSVMVGGGEDEEEGPAAGGSRTRGGASSLDVTQHRNRLSERARRGWVGRGEKELTYLLLDL